MIKRYFLFVLAVLVLSPMSHAAIVQNFDGLVEQKDMNADGKDDLTISRQEFQVTNAGEVSVAGGAVGIQWFLLIFDSEGALLSDQQYFAYSSAPTATLQLDAGFYQFAIGGFFFGEDQVAEGYSDNKVLAEVGFNGAANSVAWNVTVVSPGLEVPLPAALPLFMSSLLGLVAIRKRRKA